MRGGPPDRARGIDGLPPQPPPGAAVRLPGTPPFLVRSSAEPRYWVGVRMPIRAAGEPLTRPGTLLFASDSLIGLTLFQPWRGLFILALAIAVTAACWAPFLRGVTRSVRRLEQATTHIAEGRFDRVPVENRRDEIGRLAGSIQKMAARLDALVSGQKRFLGDTAHELRSPVARMQIALELLERDGSDRERSLIADLKEDVQAMSRLTDDLLQFAHAELAATSAPLVTLSVADVIHNAVRAEQRPGVEIRVDAPAQIGATADRRHLERAIANAVRNAVDHASKAGPIVVAARAVDNRVEISVSDSGPGVPPDALDRIFAPFFRLDASRDRKTGGAGLGLAIVRSSIEACRGSVRCVNRTPSGLEVTMTVPAARS
jgi:two-component system sensor histidine kinase CpxA